MSPHHARFVLPSSVRRGALALVITAVVGAVGIVVADRAAHTDGARRVAIRVECTDEPMCARAVQLALDVWTEERAPGEPIDLVVDEPGLEQLAAAGAAWTVIDADIDATARAEAARIRAQPTAQLADWFSEFHDYTAIEARLEELAALAPDRVSMEGIGSTLDGRTIWALHIRPTGAPSAEQPPMPMLINGTQHAREWIAAMSATCIADRLVRNAGGDDAIRTFGDTTDTW